MAAGTWQKCLICLHITGKYRICNILQKCRNSATKGKQILFLRKTMVLTGHYHDGVVE